MSLTHESHEAREALPSALMALPVVQDVAPITDAREGVWEVVLVDGLDRVPPAVHRRLARHDAGTGPVQKQGSQWVLEVR